ncbi:hypothetical protein [Flavihumibacter sp. UBA7668]|uniref:hypothetical protein n=1 Tax=Flavihumibacter sp. UBA7668 TaxID=1946542 RepID=UPI0025C1D953|nr:hypothetical protein [Flavihumibacter sp. UBA7668]
MEYYVLKYSTGKEIGKTYPQTNGMSDNYNFEISDSINFLPNLETPLFIPNLNYLKVDENAKITDFISTGLINATGFIVNEKIKSLFDNYKIADHMYFPASLYYKHKHIKAHWLHFTNDYTSLIDFNKSTFDLRSPITWDIWSTIEANIKFNTLSSLIEKHKEKEVLDQIFPEELCIKLKLEIHLLTFRYLGTRVLISETLLNQLKKEKITGYEIAEKSIPVIFSS